MKELECLLVEKDDESKLDEAAKKMYVSLQECRGRAQDYFINKDEDKVYVELDQFI